MDTLVDRQWWAYSICFITGFIILMLELTAFRLLAPFFGMSIYISGTIINIILLALAAGYLLGGYVADRKSSAMLPYSVIFTATCYLFLIYMSYSPLLRSLSRMPLLLGASLSTILMFFIPVTLLSFIPPYIVKQKAGKAATGKTTGKVYALSTLGSIFGGISTTFIFIPMFGSRVTFLIANLFLAFVSLIGFRRVFLSITLFIFLPLYVFPDSSSQQDELVYQGESAYNYIAIQEYEGTLFLKLNDGLGQHSASLKPDTMLTNYYYDRFLFAQMLMEAEKTLILGNGAGTSMMQTAHFFNTKIDGVEIDPLLTRLGQTYFGLELNTQSRVFHEDARVFMNNLNHKYDIIYVDIYAGGPWIPFHVATANFYQLAKTALSRSGVVAINLPYFSIDTKLGDYFFDTIKSVFTESVYRSGNMVYAFNGHISQRKIVELVTKRSLPFELKKMGQRIAMELEPVQATHRQIIFTDDVAPVAAMTYAALNIESIFHDTPTACGEVVY
jgi:spermidine synthase